MKTGLIQFPICSLLFLISIGCESENKEAVTEPEVALKDTASIPVVITNAAASHASIEEGNNIKILEEDTSFEIGNKVFHLDYCTLAELMKVEMQCKDTTEEDYLRRDVSLVKRMGRSLSFTLKNSAKFVLNDKGDDTDELEHYVYKGRLEKIGQYIVHVNYYEGDGYLAVNESSGEKVHLIGPLVVSPSNQYAIAGNCDLQAGYTFNGLELFEIQNNRLVLLGKKEFEGWGTKRLYWANDSTLVGEKNIFDGSSPGLESTERLKLIISNQ